MKQNFIKSMLLAALALMALNVRATDVDADAARMLASRFLNSRSHGKLRSGSAELRLSHVEPCKSDASLADYYVFNTTDEGAFVIIAGEDCGQTVLGYGNGSFDMKNVPINVQWWLDQYKEQIEFVRAHADEAEAGPRPARAPMSGGVVAPMLTCQWSQSAPYYDQCPTYGGELCVTGCVATALAQVMYYWKYPAELPPLPAYTTSYCRIQVPSLPGTVLDWDHMLDVYGNQYGEEEGAAVATLMRYCGQACYMDYSPDGSGAGEVDQLSALHRFGYSVDAVCLLRDECDDAEWERMLLEDLYASRPVLYTGHDNESGHAFVLDGYDGSMYHVNWGWGGAYDGYFTLDALGGKGWEFNYGHHMLHGVFPDAGGNAVEAYDFEQDGIYYLAEGDELAVTFKNHQFDGYSGEVNIPSTVTHEGKTYRVTAIGESAFMNCADVTAVSIPSSVTVIEANAFRNCQGLHRIHIGSNVQSIYSGAFNGCEGLETVDIDDVASWCSVEFGDFSSTPLYYAGNLTIGGQQVTELVIPGKVEKVCTGAFVYVKNITSVTIENGVREIGEYAFALCENLRSVTIPGSVKSIDYGAFLYDDALEEISLGNGVERIEDFSIYGLPLLKRITLPASVKWVGNAALAYNPALEEVTFEGSLALDTYVFYSCPAMKRVNISSLADWCATTCANSTSNPLSQAHHLYLGGEEIQSLVIPEGVKSISGNLFYGMEDLTDVTVPASIESIGADAFKMCSSLERVNISDVGSWCQIDFANESANPVCVSGHLYMNGAEVESLEVTGDVKSIKDYAFIECKSLKRVVIDGDVSTVGKSAFQYCTNLEELVIGDAVNVIGEKAFYTCTSMAELTLGGGVEMLSEKAFGSCVALTSINLMPETPPTLSAKNCFANSIYKRAVVTVPAASVDAYKSAAIWNQFKQIEAAPSQSLIGDINGDGEVTISDVNMELAALRGLLDCTSRHDINGDGEVNIADVNALIDIIIAQ